MASLDYFYDGQIRSYLIQVVRAFHGYQYGYYNRDGEFILRQVPAMYGDRSRMVAHIGRNNSENMMNSVPFIAVYVADLQMAPERRQAPQHVEHLKVREREFDEELQAYTQNEGNAYSVERYMPVPYNITVNVDIWTSNFEQQLQLFEQMGIIWNPTLDLQANVNAVDWTALTYLEMTNINWNSRSVPTGTENTINIMTLTFTLPIWLNPPAKVRKQNVIHQIITNIVELGDNCFGETGYSPSEGALLSQQIVTPGNHHIEVDGQEIRLLGEGGEPTSVTWETLLPLYGNFRPGVTEVRLKRYAENLDDLEHDIFGPVEIHPTDPSILFWTPNLLSLPPSTLPSVDAIIDPHVSFPGNGLPMPAAGQRYLVQMGNTADGLGDDTWAWGNLTVENNDIIEYDGAQWSVTFDASNMPDRQFVNNSFTGKQLVWEDGEWILSVDGEYTPGYWRLNFC